MNHMTDKGYNDDDSERLSFEPDKVTCSFCLDEISEQQVRHLKVISRNVECCEDCYEFQTNNK